MFFGHLSHAFGKNDNGCNGVHCHLCRAELGSKRASQADNSSLRSCVCSVVTYAADAKDRACINDSATTSFAHSGHHCSTHIEGSREIHVDQVMPIVVCDVFEWFEPIVSGEVH